MTRRANNVYQETFVMVLDHPQATADATLQLGKSHPTRQIRIDAVSYVNETGLAANASNAFNIKFMKGSTVIASWNTLTGQQGTITAAVPVDLVLSVTAADLVVDANTALKLFLDEGGDTTLPAGRLTVFGRFL